MTLNELYDSKFLEEEYESKWPERVLARLCFYLDNDKLSRMIDMLPSSLLAKYCVVAQEVLNESPPQSPDAT